MTVEDLADRLMRAVNERDIGAIAEIAETEREEDRSAALALIGYLPPPVEDRHGWFRAMYMAEVVGREDREHAYIPALFIGMPVGPDELRVVRTLGPAGIEQIVRYFRRERGRQAWPIVRALTRAGLIESQDPDFLIRGLVGSLGIQGRQWGPPLIEIVRDDPDLLDEIWEIFERSSAGSFALSPGWVARFGELIDAGLVDRARLLDATLDTQFRDFLERDVRAIVQLHTSLEPSVEERTARLDRYLRLIESSSPASLGCGITHARGIASPAELAPSARNALPYAPKGRAIELLGALDAPDAHALVAVCAALTHERSEVQTRATRILEKQLPKLTIGADQVREAAAGSREHVAATVRARLDAVLGDEEPTRQRIVVRTRRRRAPAPPRVAPAPFEPITGVPELVDVFASLFEGEGTGIDVERAVEGVARLGGERPAGFERLTSSLRHRLTARGPVLGPPPTVAAMRALAWPWLTEARPRQIYWRLDTRSASDPPEPERIPPTIMEGLSGLLARRLRELSERLAAGEFGKLAATPALSSGRIEGGSLATALGPADAEQASLRISGHAPLALALEYDAAHSWNVQREEYIKNPLFGMSSGSLHGGRYVLAVRTIGPHPTTIATSLARLDFATYPGAFEAEVLRPTIPSGDRLGMLWAVTAVPHHFDMLLAHAATRTVMHLSEPETQHIDVILHRACEPDITLSPMAWHAVAAALLAKTPSLQLAAGDLLAAATETDRIDPTGLGAAIAFYARNDIGILTRITPTLSAWARSSDEAASDAYETLLAFAASLDTLPTGAHAPLSLAAELRATTRADTATGPTAAALEQLATQTGRGSIAGRAIESLLYQQT
jgi:Family of unknown function (DUF6493)